MRGKRFGDSVYITFDNLWKNKENYDAGLLLLISLALTDKENELHDKTNQILASQNTVKDNNGLSDKQTGGSRCTQTV